MDEFNRRTFLRSAAATAAGAVLLPAIGQRAAWAGNVARLGVFAEPDGLITNRYLEAFDHFGTEIGRPVDLYRTYRGWGQPVLTELVKRMLAKPDRPNLYLSFHAFRGTKGTSDCLGWRDIANGQHDAQIDSWARELATLGPTYLAFHHEMENEEGVPPATGEMDGSACGTPDDFKAAYWHFRWRCEQVHGLRNLTWVITYMGNTFRQKHGGPDRWWPSSSDVSYTHVADDHLVGVDVYNRYLCHAKTWFTLNYLTGPPQQFATDKGRRFFIGECGCVEGDECGGTMGSGAAKAKWFNDALATMKRWSNLEAFCYSDVSGFQDGNYRIDSSAKALSAFKKLANDRLFTG
jgi:hypothetical protein